MEPSSYGYEESSPVRYPDGAGKSKQKSRIPGVYVGDEGIGEKERKWLGMLEGNERLETKN